MENQRKQFIASQEAACVAAKSLAELEARAGALTARLRDAGGDGGAAPDAGGPTTPLAQVMSLHEQGKDVVLSERTMPGFDFLDEADQQRVTADLRELLAGVIKAVDPVKEKLAAWKADCLAAQQRALKKRKGDGEVDLPAASATDAAAGDARPGAGAGAAEPAAGGAAASGGFGPAVDSDARGMPEQARAAVRESAAAVREAGGGQSDP
jgi:hypothetical protein